MMNQYWIVGFVLVLASVASAASINWSEADCDQLYYQGTKLTQARITLPAEIALLVNGEKINAEIQLQNGSARTISGQVDDHVLSQITCTSRSDATLAVYFNTDTIDRVANAADPIKAFKNAKDAGEIRLHAISFTSAMKLFVIEFALWFS